MPIPRKNLGSDQPVAVKGVIVGDFNRTFRLATSADIRMQSCPNRCHHPTNNVNRFKFDESLLTDLGDPGTYRFGNSGELLTERRRKLPILDPLQQSGRVYSAAHVRVFPALELAADGGSMSEVRLKYEGQDF